MINLGSKLRQLRDKHRLSQAEVADFLGITQSAYNRKESDQTEVKANELFKLAELYQIPIQKLFPENTSVPTQENRAQLNFDHNRSFVYSSEMEIELLREQNDLLKDVNALLKSRLTELEQRLCDFDNSKEM